MRIMKIVIAVHHFLPRYVGGTEWETFRLAAALQTRGHQVRVICVERVDAGPREGVAWEDDIRMLATFAACSKRCSVHLQLPKTIL